MPNWHVVLKGPTARLAHTAEDETGGIWRGDIELWRGAASWDDQPEILHAILGVQTAGGYPHGRFILHTWTIDIPERYEGLWNCGEARRYVVMRASGGFRNWTLVLKLPPHTPDFVLQVIQQAFHASVPVPVVAAPKAARKRARKATLAPPEEPVLSMEEVLALPEPDFRAQIMAVPFIPEEQPQQQKRRKRARPPEAPIRARRAVRHDAPPSRPLTTAARAALNL